MAIINQKENSKFENDKDDNIFIGLDLPFRKSEGSEGYFSSTKTTIDSIKNNIRSLLLTNVGERLMQPTLGLNLKQYLFEPVTQDLKDTMSAEISDKFNFWLPFVNIKNLEINMDQNADNLNTLKINLKFSISKDPNSLHSVQVDIN